jgi:hypothetical protein
MEKRTRNGLKESKLFFTRWGLNMCEEEGQGAAEMVPIAESVGVSVAKMVAGAMECVFLLFHYIKLNSHPKKNQCLVRMSTSSRGA